MKELIAKLAALTPERRELLLGMMRAKGISESELPILADQRPNPDKGLPLSFAQERLWIIEQLEPGNPAYHMHVTLHLKGSIHVKALTDALTRIIARHESLRTTFPTTDGTPFQCITPPLAAQLKITDLREIPHTERFPRAMALAAEGLATPFDLTAGPLYRFHLVQLDANDHVFIVTIHHILTDNWSMGIMIQELEVCYTAYLENHLPKLSELPIQYADFASWQRRVLTHETLARQLDYWCRRLAKAPRALQLPTDFARPPVQTFAGARVTFELDAAVTAILRDSAHRIGATLFMAVLAAHALVLHRLSGSESIVVGIDVAGRNRPEVEELLGFFVNQLPIVVDLANASSYMHLLEQVRSACVDAYNNQDVPFQRIVEAVQERRDRSRSPLFQAKMVHLNFPLTRGTNLPGLQSTVVPLEGVNRFELELVTWEDKQTLAGLLEYNIDLYREETATLIIDNLVSTLRQVANTPDAPLSTIVVSGQSSRALTAQVINDDFDF